MTVPICLIGLVAVVSIYNYLLPLRILLFSFLHQALQLGVALHLVE